jgi:hypothetical protein
METNDFGMGFFGRRFFGEDGRKKFREEWSKMSDSEKVEFVNKRMDFTGHCGEGFSVEAMDARCEAWMKKTPEEKKEFVDNMKDAIHNHMHGMGGFFARGMREDCLMNQPK